MRAANALYIYIMKAKQPIPRDSHIGIFQDTFALGRVKLWSRVQRGEWLLFARAQVLWSLCRKLPQRRIKSACARCNYTYLIYCRIRMWYWFGMLVTSFSNSIVN